MKKLIFGCTLMICGVVGGTGWLIPGGAYSSIQGFQFDNPECYIVLFFYAIAVLGTVIAVKALKDEKAK